MLCWAYPVKAHFRRRRAVAQSFNEKLRLSRRGADFTQEHLDCYWSKPVNQCNKLYENDFDPLNWLGMLNKMANKNKLIFLENDFSLHFMVYGQWKTGRSNFSLKNTVIHNFGLFETVLRQDHCHYPMVGQILIWNRIKDEKISFQFILIINQITRAGRDSYAVIQFNLCLLHQKPTFCMQN